MSSEAEEGVLILDPECFARSELGLDVVTHLSVWGAGARYTAVVRSSSALNNQMWTSNSAS